MELMNSSLSIETPVGNRAHRIMRLKEVISTVGLSRSTIYARLKDGTFPAPIRIGINVGWIESEIQDWIEEQIAASRGTESRDR